MTTRATTTLATLAALALPILGSGCKQPVLCPALDSCTGPIDPATGLPVSLVGDWILDASHPSCSEDLYTPPADPRLVGADLPPARTPPPEPALYDWCDLLVTGPALDVAGHNDIVVKKPNFFAESAPIGAATLHYGADHHYVLSTTRTGQYLLDFPAYCMRAFSAVDTPLDPAMPPGATGSVCDKLTASLQASTTAKYYNISCGLDAADPPGGQGCLCTFDLTDRLVSQGTVLSPMGTNMIHLPGNDFPENVSYCLQGDRLQLTGKDGAYLFDRPGLRTLDLVRVTVNCADGVRGPGEDGVDCGPACPMLCAP